MERYRNFVRIEQMKENIRSGKMEAALELAHELEPAKVRSTSDLNILADLYLENGMLAKARECLTELYGRRKTRSVLMQLVNLSIRLKKVNDAEKYYREFKAMAPGDFYNYIFRYNIDKIEGKPYENLIESLERLRDAEFIDSWAYELAKLYHKAGQKEKCVKECEDIITWFGDGEYVERARALKAYYNGELNIEAGEEAVKQGGNEATGTEEVEEPEKPEELGEEELTEITESSDEEPISETEEETLTAESEEAAGEEEQITEESTEAPDGEKTEAGEQEAAEEKQTAEDNSTETAEQADEASRAEAAAQPDEAEDYSEDDIELAADVFAEIDGIDGYAYEAPVVNIEGFEETEDEQKDTTEAAENTGESDEAVETGKPELVEHTFKGLRTAVISEDSLLAEFLRKKGTELKDYFGFFAYQPEVRSQIIKVLEILLNPQIKNISLAITGEHNCGVKGIIKGMTRIMYQSGFLNGQQVAFTDAEKINSMKLSEKTDRLIGCCLAINHAGRLNSDAAAELMEANEKFAGRTAVVLIDYRSEMNRLFRDNRELNSMFPQRVHIPTFDKDDLEDLLFVKLEEGGYSLEKSAHEQIQKELRRIIRDVREGSLTEADKYISSILDRVETRKAKSLMEGNFEVSMSSDESIITVEDIS